MCFVEYMPFTQGLIVPIKITDIKANILTDNTAEVFYEMRDKEDVVKMWWHLVYANGEWRIDNWKNDHEDERAWLTGCANIWQRGKIKGKLQIT